MNKIRDTFRDKMKEAAEKKKLEAERLAKDVETINKINKVIN